MKCLQFDTAELAHERNMQEATARGCTGSISNEWWPEFEQDGKFYLEVGDDVIEDGEEVVEVEKVVVIEEEGK